METCFSYTDKNVAFFSTDERRHITRILKLKEKYPNEIEIIKYPAENDGCLYCKLPPRAMKIQITKVEMTEEEKQALRDRLAAARNS
jgi:hypothetical protein